MSQSGRFLSIAPQHIRTARRTSPKGSEPQDPTRCNHSQKSGRMTVMNLIVLTNLIVVTAT